MILNLGFSGKIRGTVYLPRDGQAVESVKYKPQSNIQGVFNPGTVVVTRPEGEKLPEILIVEKKNDVRQTLEGKDIRILGTYDVFDPFNKKSRKVEAQKLYNKTQSAADLDVSCLALA